MDAFTFRLRPGQDLFDEIESVVAENDIRAGCILSAVGSLTQATLRLANRDTCNTYTGHFEIVSATGTVSKYGSPLHLAISDGQGRTLGGHLVSGCTVYTTAEIVLAVFPHLIYRREPCSFSGYNELVISQS